jgi:hypothetical protein
VTKIKVLARIRTAIKAVTKIKVLARIRTTAMPITLANQIQPIALQ